MYKVAVLLSTYNGEKYLPELLESIRNQEDVELSTIVRDDGSNDGTMEILERYRDECNITILNNDGTNLGPAMSFLEILRQTEDAENFAYCDQDDVWNVEKLNRACRALSEVGTNQGALYVSTYEVTDQKLCNGYIYNMHFESPYRLADTLIYRSPSGCTMVFNKQLRDKIAKSNPEYVRMHDFWTLLIAEAFHYTIITDPEPRLKYRQHSDNSVGIVPSFWVKMSRLLYSAFFNKNERWKQAYSLLTEYEEELPEDSLKILKKLVEYRKSFSAKRSLLKSKDYRTSSERVNLLFRIAVLFGVF